MNNSWFDKTFAKSAVLIYCLGALIHFSRPILKFTADDIPFFSDTIIFTLAGYGGAGFIFHFSKVEFKNFADRILYSLILFHLNVSAIVHFYSFVARDHEWISMFPIGYSYFAVAYFLGFAYYSFRLDKRLAAKAPTPIDIQ